METAFAPTADLVDLRDVEDLHDSDLEQVLADRLADGENPGDAAAALARLVAQAGPTAMLVHDLRPAVAGLASRRVRQQDESVCTDPRVVRGTATRP